MGAALREAEESGLTDSPPVARDPDVDVHAIPRARASRPTSTTTSATPRDARARRDPRDDAESIALRWFSLDEAARAMDDLDATRALERIGRLLDAARV